MGVGHVRGLEGGLGAGAAGGAVSYSVLAPGPPSSAQPRSLVRPKGPGLGLGLGLGFHTNSQPHQSQSQSQSQSHPSGGLELELQFLQAAPPAPAPAPAPVSVSATVPVPAPSSRSPGVLGALQQFAGGLGGSLLPSALTFGGHSTHSRPPPPLPQSLSLSLSVGEGEGEGEDSERSPILDRAGGEGGGLGRYGVGGE